MTMMGRIAILLITTIAAASADDNSTMHIMDGPNNSSADPCATMKCANGTVCQLQTVNCIKAPCPPIANCVAPSNNTVDPCAAVKCANGTVCKMQTVNCLLPPCPPLPQCVAPSNGPSCMTMKCAANTTCVDLPTGSVCQPNSSNNTVDPCATMLCATGTICKLQTVNCLVPPCPPIPQCVASSNGPSCMTMKCAANTSCVDLPTGSVCQPNSSNNTVDPCATMLCATGTICKLQTVNCLLPPCPPIAQCVTPSTGPSCMTMKCAANTTCVDLPTGSVCQPNGSNTTVDPCASIKCGNGTICALQTVNCLLPPCPPLPQCITPPAGPSCLTMKCAANTTCVDLPTGSVCQPNGGDNSTTNPCALMLCAVGTVCELQNVMCKKEPCPPVAACVSRTTNSSACMHIKCSAGFECRNGDKGEMCYPVSAPQPDACANYTCPAGQSCSVIMINCLVAPCPPPKPSCVPRQRDDACQLTECAKGFFCITQHGEPECIKASGASCAATSCPMNTTCIDYKEGAACLEQQPTSNLTCATVKCGGGTRCMITPNGPTCYPVHGESPCNAMECTKGFFCVVQHGEPECVAHSGASCAATSCPVNTTCIEFREGATCMAGLMSGGCANMTCGGGSRCKETLDGPRCISGGKRDHRIVDIYGCGRGEQYTECLPQCEDTCRGIATCDLSIPAPSNSSTWPSSNSSTWTPANSTIWTNSTMGNSTNLPSHCISGCVCRDKFKRNVQGNCVPNSRCWLTPGCRDNESWSHCVGCERTCANPTGAQICAAVCRSGCACDEGYVRSKRGMCVLPEDCRAIDLINGDHGNNTIAIVG